MDIVAESELATMIMMSGNGAVDPRIKKLIESPTLWQFDIADGWNVRVKISADIDDSQYIDFGTRHGGIFHHYILANYYFCVYLDDDLKYASCYMGQLRKREEIYDNGTVPDRISRTNDYSDFIITSGEMTVNRSSSSNFLTISVKGACTRIQTTYNWSYETGWEDSETTTVTETFSTTKYDFGGSYSGYMYIVNGSPDDFKNAVCGLYAACCKLADSQNL